MSNVKGITKQDSNGLPTKEYIVYVARFNGEVMYVGEGKRGRESHITSGTSHVYEANRFHFAGKKLEVTIEHELSDKDASKQMENTLIEKYKPLWNKMDATLSNPRMKIVFKKYLKLAIINKVITNKSQIEFLEYVISRVKKDGICTMTNIELSQNTNCNSSNKILSSICCNDKHKYFPKKLIKFVTSSQIADAEYKVMLTQDFMDGKLVGTHSIY